METEPTPPDALPDQREQTDKCLNVERVKTDAEIAKRQAALEAGGQVVEKAREQADVVVQKARLLADEKLEREGATDLHREAIDDERAQHDAVLKEERRTADAADHDDQEERLKALASLLRLERDETNERLSVEREHADVAVSSRDDFLGMVSHDLRSLLGGVAVAAAQQVSAAPDGESGERITRLAQRIQRFTARMNRMIGDLLDVTSIDAGRLAVSPGQTDVAKLLSDSVETFQHAAAAKRVVLTADPLDGPLEALGDEGRILQVLGNLLSNAIKFTREGGKVSVSAEPLEGEIQFAVTDDGPGIAKDHLESIFGRFWQVNRRDACAIGLGLFIARSIVEAHAGRIWVKSAPGKGSTFFFTLPRSLAHAESTKPVLH